MADDNSTMWGDFGGPLEGAFTDFTNSMTPDSVFGSDFMSRAVNGTLAAARKTAKEQKPVDTTAGYDKYFANQATVGNFEKGHEPLGLQQGKPASQSRPARGEDPLQVYLMWHENMKRFGYGS